jgi:hypothetical protein
MLLQVLDARQQVERDIQALAASQAAVLAAARPFVNTTNTPSSSSTSSTKAASPQLKVLSHEVDKAYLVACKCTEWREMIEASCCCYCCCCC